jgi:TIR domain
LAKKSLGMCAQACSSLNNGRPPRLSSSARLFDVFLDTHGIAPAEDFQTMLWHRLCDSDVLVMLDTPNYFGSRWTSAEFGRALAKGIAVLRVGWPGS